MAHEIVFDEHRNISPIAFVGEVPWHGLGQQIAPHSPLETWAQQAGMDWEIKSGPALYMDDEGLLRGYPGRQMLRRGDTQYPLSIVSDAYKVVQPAEVLGFFKDIIEAGGFRMNTAGCLFGGQKFWALAEVGKDARILGQDKIESFLLLATSCDGTLATTAMFTSVRVVCNNTLGFAVSDGQSGLSRRYLKVPHSRTFDPQAVKEELGLAEKSFDAFADSANALARRKVGDREALEWLVRVFGKIQGDEVLTAEQLELADAKNVKACMELYKGAGRGSGLKSADGTAWGLVNCVTEFADHKRNTHTADRRLDSAWFGDSANLKQRAWNEALRLVA
jgi:phage/plasmid-like protein (TIGR03299 family)